MNNEEVVVLASQILWLAFLCSIVPALLTLINILRKRRRAREKAAQAERNTTRDPGTP